MQEPWQVLKRPLGVGRMGRHLSQNKGCWEIRTLGKKGRPERNKGRGGGGQRSSKQRGHFKYLSSERLSSLSGVSGHSVANVEGKLHGGEMKFTRVLMLEAAEKQDRWAAVGPHTEGQ